MVSTSQKRSPLTPRNSISSTEHYQIVIVGGGAAGITTTAQLLKQDSQLEIAIIEPNKKHYYQPGWTLVGGGIAPIEKFIRQQKDVIPQKAKWIEDYVTTFDRDRNTLTVARGQQIKYDYLVVCPGIQIDWHLIRSM